MFLLSSQHGRVKNPRERLSEILKEQTFRPAQILVVDSLPDGDALEIYKASGHTHLDRC
jgi:hypothetical protein